jgi:hypothetical protein
MYRYRFKFFSSNLYCFFKQSQKYILAAIANGPGGRAHTSRHALMRTVVPSPLGARKHLTLLGAHNMFSLHQSTKFVRVKSSAQACHPRLLPICSTPLEGVVP